MHLRWVIRAIVIVAIVAFLGMRLAEIAPYEFEDTGTIAASGALCLGIDLDGDKPGVRPVEGWPPGIGYDRARGVLVGADGQAIAADGDRVSVAGTFVRQDSGDINPCDAVERLQVHRIEVIRSGSPGP
jgi:hypothetical protein